MAKAGNVLLLLATFLTAVTYVSGGAESQTVLNENFNNLNGWSQTACVSGHHSCGFNSVNTEFETGSNSGWGHTYIAARGGCTFGDLQSRIGKTFNVQSAGDYRITGKVIGDVCDICNIQGRVYIDGSEVYRQDGIVWWLGWAWGDISGNMDKVVALSKGDHKIEVGVFTSIACNGNFDAFFDDIKIKKDGPTCNSNGVCDADETVEACPSECSDFSISLNPVSGIANKGDTKETNASAARTMGAYSSVSFSTQGLPIKTRDSFFPASCTLNCSSNASIILSRDTPVGTHNINVTGSGGTVNRSAAYSLQVLAGDVNSTCGNLICETGETSLTCASDCDASCTNNGACSLREPMTCPDCGTVNSSLGGCGNSACEYPETQKTCSADCKTTATMSSPVAPGEVVPVTVDFRDWRYKSGDKVRIDLKITPGDVGWTPANGCFFGGKNMKASSSAGDIAWPTNTISEDGHFRINTTCTVPTNVAAGAKTLTATPTIY